MKLSIRRLPARVLLGAIALYRRVLSPLFPPSCRFTPTCSMYAEQAISRYGALKGGYLTLKRIIKCNPFHEGGYDPIP